MAIPTKWPIDHRCGHTVKIDLKQKYSKGPSEREGFAHWASKAWSDPEKGRDCPDCFKQKRQVDFNQWMLDVEEFEQRYILPELRGSEKQFSSGLIDSARRDRHSVISELFDPERSGHMDKHGSLLDAVRVLDHVNWWTNNLGFKVRKERNYGQDEAVELILDGAEVEAQRQAAQQQPGSEYIESENPHHWDGHQD